MNREIQSQLIAGVLTTAGSVGGLLVANHTGWNKTITIGAGAFTGLVIGVGLGIIGNKRA